MSVEEQELHYQTIVREMARGRVVPLLGAGVNLCGRPHDATWDYRRRQFLPSGGELAGFLAEEFRYPASETNRDLMRVSQYAAITRTPQTLHNKLHDIFDADYTPSALHTFLACLPGVLRAHDAEPRYQLIVTTNYDDVLESAFCAADEPFDLVAYIADGDDRGKFSHKPPGEPARVIRVANEYAELSLERRTVIVKIHGAVDRQNPYDDSYVITEDDYIDYLTRTSITKLLPMNLLNTMIRSSFLFLGYSMRDWNLRVILHRIWGERKRRSESWAVQAAPDQIESQFWKERDVNILDVRLEQYVVGLQAQLDGLFGAGVG
jgi:hypothetical protein